VFVGRGALQAAVESRARELQLGQRVLLAGEAAPDSLALWYGASDLLLLTSKREGRPNVVLEALSSGLPVLATDAGGTRELLRDIPGALLERRDTDAIAARVVTALRSPPDRELLRAQALSFGWEVGLDALDALLRNATGEVR
jgi:glycosyltransferase involved in cell wall biosynthesis